MQAKQASQERQRFRVVELVRGQGTVNWFSEWMLKKLEDNTHKPHWSGDAPTRLLEKLRVEVRELDVALDEFCVMARSSDEYSDLEKIRITTDVIKECADVSNFGMMIADNVSKSALRMVFQMSKSEVLKFLCTSDLP